MNIYRSPSNNAVYKQQSNDIWCGCPSPTEQGHWARGGANNFTKLHADRPFYVKIQIRLYCSLQRVHPFLSFLSFLSFLLFLLFRRNCPQLMTSQNTAIYRHFSIPHIPKLNIVLISNTYHQVRLIGCGNASLLLRLLLPLAQSYRHRRVAGSAVHRRNHSAL